MEHDIRYTYTCDADTCGMAFSGGYATTAGRGPEAVCTRPR